MSDCSGGFLANRLRITPKPKNLIMSCQPCSFSPGVVQEEGEEGKAERKETFFLVNGVHYHLDLFRKKGRKEGRIKLPHLVIDDGQLWGFR